MKRTLFGALALSLSMSAAFADGLMAMDPYARVSTKMSKSGAAFMVLHNHTDAEQTLVAARGDVAERIELHTHIEDGDGVMRMTEVEGGIPVPAHGMVALERGGLHVMFLGLTRPLEHGDTIDLTLVFEPGGEVDVTVPVDLERQPAAGMGHGHTDHGTMDHDKMDHDKMDHGDHDHKSDG